MALVSHSLRAGRRRTAINRALHELRRPLQVLALAGPGAARGSLDLAFLALDRLDAEVNGSDPPAGVGAARCRAVLESCVARWGSRAALAGGSIGMTWRGSDDARMLAPAEVAQAVDNLIVNALEHGGPSIHLDAKVDDETIRIRVTDNGRRSRQRWRAETPGEAVARLTGRRRRGHGFEVVRQLARAQGGRFVFQRSRHSSTAA